LAASRLGSTIEEQPGNEDAALMIMTLHRNVRQLEALVAKVLEENANLLSEESFLLERRYFDLWPMVESLLRSIGPVAQNAGTRIVNAIPHDLVVHADATMLRRVFQNLLSNSIAYTAKGEVHIGAKHNDSDTGLEFWVSDNGSGVTKARLERIFEKGQGDAKRAESTGLGLANVRPFVEAHGGTVRAESVDGSGTTVIFNLPDESLK